MSWIMSFLNFLVTYLRFSVPKQYYQPTPNPKFHIWGTICRGQAANVPLITTNCQLQPIDIVAEKMQKYAEGTSF